MKKKTHDWQQLIIVLTLGWVVIWIYRDTFPPIYPVIKDFFGDVSDVKIGKISSSYFLGYAAMQIPSGLLVDRIGRKAILIPGFLLFAVGTATVSLADSLSWVYFGSLLAGIGCGTYYGVAYSLTTEVVPAGKRSMATAIVNSGTALGCGIGLISSNLLVGGGWIAWQKMLYLPFVLTLGMTMVFQLTIKEPASQRRRELRDRESVKLYAFFKPQMVATYFLYFCTLYPYYLMDTWLPNFLLTERQVPSSIVGVVSSLVFFVAIPGALLFSYLADRMRDKRVTLILFLELLAALLLFVTLRTMNQALMIVGFIAYGFFGKLAVEPIIISWLSQFAPSQSLATTFGIFNFFGMLASVLVPTITGLISDQTGSKVYGFYLAIVIILLGSFVFFLVNRYTISQDSRVLPASSKKNTD